MHWDVNECFQQVGCAVENSSCVVPARLRPRLVLIFELVQE